MIKHCQQRIKQEIAKIDLKNLDERDEQNYRFGQILIKSDSYDVADYEECLEQLKEINKK